MTPPLSPSDLESLATSIKEQALDIGFDKVGITRVDRWSLPAETSDPATLDPQISPLMTAEQHLQTWLDRGFQADLTWMESPKRQDIRQVMPGVKSVIAVAMN